MGFYGKRRVAASKIGRFLKGAVGRRKARMYAKKRGAITRAIGYNPMPTFTETYQKAADNLVVVAGTAGLGKVFKVRISDIPQIAQYMNLYTQYRINWVKVMLLPAYNSATADHNVADYNRVNAVPYQGMARIVYSIQDSPNEQTPASEAEVLQDNGCKIKAFKTKWSCSYKPVPDVKQATDVGAIYTRQKFRQWFNYDGTTTGNNPEHGAVAAWITLPGDNVLRDSSMSYYCYYKVNFSLRDPK